MRRRWVERRWRSGLWTIVYENHYQREPRAGSEGGRTIILALSLKKSPQPLTQPIPHARFPSIRQARSLHRHDPHKLLLQHLQEYQPLLRWCAGRFQLLTSQSDPTIIISITITVIVAWCSGCEGQRIHSQHHKSPSTRSPPPTSSTRQPSSSSSPCPYPSPSPSPYPIPPQPQQQSTSSTY